MAKINELRNLLKDIKYRASQHGFDIESHFDTKGSAIRIVRRKTKEVIWEKGIGIVNPRSKNEQVKTQIIVMESFISYMAFYGIFQVAFSYDENKKEKIEKEKEKKDEA